MALEPSPQKASTSNCASAATPGTHGVQESRVTLTPHGAISPSMTFLLC